MMLQKTRKMTEVPLTKARLIDEQHIGGRKRIFRRDNAYLWLCAGLPALIVLLLYFARGHHPIGDGTVLVLDMTAQYVWFFEALRDAVLGDGSLLYSFSRALGGEFLGIYAYYIASPFSYLVCLFPQDRMLEAMLFIFALKTAISGATFGFYMHKTMKERSPLSVVIFSCCYALCAYAIVQQHNTMWIDALMWLPLLTYSIEQLVKKGNFKLYTAILALTVFSNFYIGYMVCIYCFFYFFLFYFAQNENNENNLLREKMHFLRSLLRIAIFSVLALGIAAIILLSAYYSLNFGKTTFSSTTYEWVTNFDLMEFLYKFLPGSYDTVRPEGLPFVYCGLITLLFVPAYFLSKKYSVRQKIFDGALIFVLVASLTLSAVDLIWHGFQAPNWLNYRYSFMLCFILCVIACRGFADFKNLSLKVVMGTSGLIALFCVMLQKHPDDAYVKPHDYTCIWFTLIALFAYLAILGLLRCSANPRAIALVLVAVVCVELFLNGLFNTISLDYDVTYSRYSYYNNFLDSTRPITNKIQEADDSFYRMEKTSWRAINDNMALQMRGLTGSTSTLNAETIAFLQKMGYASKSHWSKYLGGTPVNDSILGVKYIVSKNSIYGNYYDVFASDASSGFVAYKNPYALPIAYGVDDDVLKFPLGYTNVVEMPTNNTSSNKDDKEKKDYIGNFVSKIKNEINQLLDIDESIRSSEYIDKYNNPFDRVNAMLGAMLGTGYEKVYTPITIKNTFKENLKSYSTSSHQRYVTVDDDFPAMLTYRFEVPSDGEVYFYLPARYLREVELYLTSSASDEGVELGNCNGNDTNRIISLGYHTAGTVLDLDLELKKSDLYVMSFEDLFYQIDWQAFESAFSELAEDPFQVTEYTEDSFEGSFTASSEHELVMTTIAYDKGWKIYVDGKEVETAKAFGSLVSFYVDGEAGQTHDIRMIYRPNTLVIGGWISAGSLLIFLVLVVLDVTLLKRRRQRRYLPLAEAAVTSSPNSPVAQRKKIGATAPVKTKTLSAKGVAKKHVSLYQRNTNVLGEYRRRR